MSFVSNRCSCVSNPFTDPFSKTRIRSASWTLETLCAIIIFVVPGITSRNAFRIFASVAVSTALVESSRIKIFGFFNNALAIQRRCFWPPDTFVPPRSIHVSYPSGRRSINSSAQAARQASLHSSTVASSFPHLKLSRIVPEKSTFFCRTTETSFRSTSISYSRTSFPPAGRNCEVPAVPPVLPKYVSRLRHSSFP